MSASDCGHYSCVLGFSGGREHGWSGCFAAPCAPGVSLTYSPRGSDWESGKSALSRQRFGRLLEHQGWQYPPARSWCGPDARPWVKGDIRVFLIQDGGDRYVDVDWRPADWGSSCYPLTHFEPHGNTWMQQALDAIEQIFNAPRPVLGRYDAPYSWRVDAVRIVHEATPAVAVRLQQLIALGWPVAAIHYTEGEYPTLVDALAAVDEWELTTDAPADALDGAREAFRELFALAALGGVE